MIQITLERINEENFIDAFHLKLGKDQKRFVSHPIRSLAQAYVYYRQCTPFGIFLEETMVGYVMVIYDYDLEEYNIWHMMIDKKFQGRGYGKAAMEACLVYVASKPFGVSNRVVLTCHKENLAALSLYHKFGFVETGIHDDEEIELALELTTKI
ncbi:MAG: GNAT family N-acetyltransferase [Oscillospiraceae bacterium]|nr:GNAT family N-acetyltransferase [Oscillospiraceae bacterium]